ncbi:hypothetical protein Metli_1570 [Methanofollis liminatans DSM 4140]|jgi:hypothetical protein|uniref:Uncharacterized protein n=1 Tax=Methanofollis liminatans DSM 4140 TaxID=28892 RepID=J0S0X7_9EURY|nr:hypothetical protein [Methanofollis liminatans]EJG07521.1 hypothetical protein Metli_1570 [Methanofollis liminatans DSM 4140]
MEKIISFDSEIEFVARINEVKDCLMQQGPEGSSNEDPGKLWFNIDVPKGHGFRAGDRVRITIEKI